ncbi:MAG: ABC transporter permease [Anaerolineae bacterium]|nr:ABC transporter permease [Anaerolineae bacterium]
MSREYILRRFIRMIFTLWVIMTIIFFMFRLIPADPASLLIDSSLTSEGQQQLREFWGIDKPVFTQYLTYMGNLLKLDFGRSFFYRVPVMEVLGPFLRNSLVLMVPAVVLAIVAAIGIGSYMGWKRGSIIERWGIMIPLVLHGVPLYWLGLVALIVFSFWLRWFPSSGMRELGYTAETVWDIYFNVDFLRHLILPMMTAAIYLAASPIMLMRSSMIEVQNEEFLDVIRAKGVPERVVVRHAMRNALLPVVTYLAFLATIAVAGSVLLETVFSWPGIGRALVEAVNSRDYPLAQAAFFMWSASVVIMYFIVDILYHKLDPRISLK